MTKMRDRIVARSDRNGMMWCEQEFEQKFYDLAASVADQYYARGRDLLTSMKMGINMAYTIALLRKIL